MIAYGMTDGSNEQGNYADPDYKPVNVPMIVKQPGTVMADPNRWQPLALDLIVTQNGIPLPGNVQVAIGTRWRKVKAFARRRRPGGRVADRAVPASAAPPSEVGPATWPRSAPRDRLREADATDVMIDTRRAVR